MANSFPIGSKLLTTNNCHGRFERHSGSIFSVSHRSRLPLIAVVLLAPRAADAITFDGDVTYTSDYIYRGISETGGRSAAQIDLHLATGDGTFVGVFASTLDRLWHRGYETLGWDYELEQYLGHRFDLSQCLEYDADGRELPVQAWQCADQ